MERLKPHVTTLTLFVSLTAIFILRYALVRHNLDMAPDTANYLTTMNTLFGWDVTGIGLLRPPLIALPLKAFTLVFGDLTGAKLLGVLLSVSIGIPFYLIARRICRPWIAVAMTILFVLTPTYTSMLSWGYITMTGILFILLALYYYLLVIESPSKLNILLAGLFASLVAGFHQLSLVFFVLLFVTLIAASFIFNRAQFKRNLVPFMISAALGVGLCLPYVPVYVHMMQMQSSGASSAVPLVQFASDIPWLWAIIISAALALVILASLGRNDRSMAILLAVLIVLPLILMIFPLRPPFVELNRRAHFFLYVPIWAITGLVLSRAWAWKRSLFGGTIRNFFQIAVVGLTISLLIYGGIVSQRELHQGLDFYTYLDKTRWDAMQWIKLHTPENATVVAYPENLGWWIESEAHRTTFEVTDRDMEALNVERQRALVAEQLLSRNRGMDNGYIRIATSYPYTNVSGNPVIGAYVGGKYQDLLMFDDSQSLVQIAGVGTFNMNNATTKELSIHGDPSSMETIVSYYFDGAMITQTVTLKQDSQMAIVTYTIQSNDQAMIRLQLPSFFCYQPESVLHDPENSHIEVVQRLETPFHGVVPVTTQLAIDVTGATYEVSSMPDNHIPLVFDTNSTNASVTLTFDISTNQPPPRGQVTAYEVPRVIDENGIGYLVVDLKPNSAVFSDAPLGLEQWLNACPYYKLVYSKGDIRIYQVETSALP